MKHLTPLVAAVALLIASPVLAQTPGTSSAPAASTVSASENITVTAYYKQNVYDNDNNKIGQIVDVLVSKDGKINNLVIGAGGFLGMGKHDVMVPFSAVKMVKDDQTPRNDPKAKNRDRERSASTSYRLVMDTTKDKLKAAPGVKYDRTAMTWVPDDSSSSSTTTGRKSR